MNRRIPALAAVLVAAGALSACHHGGQGYGPTNANLCRAFHTSDSPVNASDPAAVFDDCLHRWAYSFAPARDQADVVASAVTAACSANLSHWNQQTLSQQSMNQQNMAQQGMPGMPPGSMPQQAPAQSSDQGGATDLSTGQPTDMMTARAQFAQSRALFYVVEARAGGCSPPSGKPPANEP